MTLAVKGHKFFGDSSIPDLEVGDLEGFELFARLKPRKDPTSGKILGTIIDWETMKPIPKVVAVEETDADEDEAFNDIPF